MKEVRGQKRTSSERGVRALLIVVCGVLVQEDSMVATNPIPLIPPLSSLSLWTSQCSGRMIGERQTRRKEDT